MDDSTTKPCIIYHTDRFCVTEEYGEGFAFEHSQTVYYKYNAGGHSHLLATGKISQPEGCLPCVTTHIGLVMPLAHYAPASLADLKDATLVAVAHLTEWLGDREYVVSNAYAPLDDEEKYDNG